MTQRIKVLLLIPHLGGGGAEQVTALLARGLSRQKYELHLGLITQAYPGAEPPPPWVHLHSLDAPRVRAGAFRLLKLVRRIKPDVILSGMAHLNFLLLLLRPFFLRRTRILVRQNATVSTSLDSRDLPGYTRLLYRLLYRHADRVICQTQAMAHDLTETLGIPEARLAVLPNPVDVEAVRAAAEDPRPPWIWPRLSPFGPHLLAVGRLAREKGFDLLLQALVTVRERFSEADLTIAGAGPQQVALESLSRELGLRTVVRFAGRVDCPAALFSGASLFVLSSRHEGLPNALLEAAAGGLPIVALPASAGLVDLLRSQPGAWLAPEVSSAALAATLLAALEVLRPGERFAHPFIERFRIERAVRAYEDLIDAVLNERQP